MTTAISVEVMDVFNFVLQRAIREAETRGRVDLALGLAEIKLEMNRRSYLAKKPQVGSAITCVFSVSL